MKIGLKKITGPFLQWWFKKYYTKPRSFSYQDLDITIYPGVFPPEYTFSTKILLKHLDNLELKGKSLLELGCGSGIISLYASKKEALVTATDINKNALEQLKKSAVDNQLGLEIIESDLFKKISQPHFDYIIINPPYYPKNPKSIDESAWYCGEDFAYFKKLFQQLPKFVESRSNIIMILSKDCDIQKIQTIAQSNHLDLNLIKTEKSFWEVNYLYKIVEK